jgi:hypothetical protein
MPDNQNNQQQEQENGLITEYLSLKLKDVSDKAIDETKVAETYVHTGGLFKRG